MNHPDLSVSWPQNLEKDFNEWTGSWITGINKWMIAGWVIQYLPFNFNELDNIILWDFLEFGFNEMYKKQSNRVTIRIWLKEKQALDKSMKKKIMLYKFHIFLSKCFGLLSCFYCYALEEQICSKLTKVKDPTTLFIGLFINSEQVLPTSRWFRSCSEVFCAIAVLDRFDFVQFL